VATSFGGALRTMDSLRKPKRIVAYASDQRDYRFLVKGGEDLRQDQRIQQIFKVVSRILAADGQCASRQLCMV